MMFGQEGNSDHRECNQIINSALDGGINFIDTADAYSAGESERPVGNALRGRRERVILATKMHFRIGTDIDRGGNSRRWIL